MPKSSTAINININEEPKSIIEEYKELEIVCDQLIEKITKRKSKKINKLGRKNKK